MLLDFLGDMISVSRHQHTRGTRDDSHALIATNVLGAGCVLVVVEVCFEEVFDLGCGGIKGKPALVVRVRHTRGGNAGVDKPLPDCLDCGFGRGKEFVNLVSGVEFSIAW